MHARLADARKRHGSHLALLAAAFHGGGAAAAAGARSNRYNRAKLLQDLRGRQARHALVKQRAELHGESSLNCAELYGSELRECVARCRAPVKLHHALSRRYEVCWREGDGRPAAKERQRVRVSDARARLVGSTTLDHVERGSFCIRLRHVPMSHAGGDCQAVLRTC